MTTESRLEPGLRPLLTSFRSIGPAEAVGGSFLPFRPRRPRGALKALAPFGSWPEWSAALSLAPPGTFAIIVARGVALLLIPFGPLGAFVMLLLVKALTPILWPHEVKPLHPLPPLRAGGAFLEGLAGGPLPLRAGEGRTLGKTPALPAFRVALTPFRVALTTFRVALTPFRVAFPALEARLLFLPPLELGLERRFRFRGRLQGALPLGEEA
jgi:hypothetical protein